MATSLLVNLNLIMAAIIILCNISSVSSTNTNTSLPPPISPRNQNEEIGAAIGEMRSSNYFTFVMLMNMVGPFDERLEKNVTFLMPNDQMLSEVGCQWQWHMRRGTLSKPGYILTVSNNASNNAGRYFYLNNVKIVKPNVCAASASSIRCHGIDGVLAPLAPPPPLPPPDQDDDSCSDKAPPASSSSVDDNPNTPAAVPASPQTDPANLKSSAAASSLFLSSHEQGHCLRMSLTSCAILLSIFISMI
ncbi:hypothetical protein Pyn_13313 [Prunus yedoensis var. nudiflora]|uniref:Uncharacterized protein n=1 Tax=Prunus yedoensis var. nudiflora TaxID=2094558 RepID=A0A314UWN3_PRUYE|nr:hypothetical protein Pyn_13313 [Prunus yedoensis var. nudiflora]